MRGRCAQRSSRSQIVPIHEIQGYSLNLSHHSSNPIHVDPRILFCQQMFMFCRQLLNYFKTLGKSSVIDDFWKYLVFSTRSWTSSHVTWRHGSSEDQLKCDSYPWNFFLIKKWKKFKKGAQNVSKRWSKTMVLPANPFKASLFSTFEILLQIKSSKTPWAADAYRSAFATRYFELHIGREGERERGGILFCAHQRQGASRNDDLGPPTDFGDDTRA